MTQQKQHRNTPQRRMVLEELQKVTSHPTAVELYEMVRKRMPKVSLGTIYRNLELLAEMGLIQKVDLVSSEARFDGNPKPHHHVRCATCGRVGDLHELPLDMLREVPSEIGGYSIIGHKLEFVGICGECNEGE
jgi:Fur family ferric uptake transcriptional regulator